MVLIQCVIKSALDNYIHFYYKIYKKKTIIFKYNSAVKARIKFILLYCFYSTLSFSNLILLDYIEFNGARVIKFSVLGKI